MKAEVLFFSFSTSGMKKVAFWIKYHALGGSVEHLSATTTSPPPPCANMSSPQYAAYSVYMERMGIRPTNGAEKDHITNMHVLLWILFLVMVRLTLQPTQSQLWSMTVPHSHLHRHTHCQCNNICVGGDFKGVTNIWRGLNLPLSPAGSFDRPYLH